MINISGRVQDWAENLSAEQMRPLLAELVIFAIEAEMVKFPELAPYWSNTGDPLIAGQKTFKD